MKLARPVVNAAAPEAVGQKSDILETGEHALKGLEGSNPSPSTRRPLNTEDLAGVAPDVGEQSPVPVGGLDKTAAITPPTYEQWIESSHLWMLEGRLVVRGMVVTGREATSLPWRRKNDNEPASQAEIARELELVAALAIRGKIQVPSDFASTKLYLREDVK